MPANHPNETQLALYSGNDLGHWETWRIRRHLAQCSACRRQVLNHRENAEAIRAHAAEMPGQFNWSRLAEEMTGNVRVGLAAGECIAGFEKAAHPIRPRIAWQAGLAVAGLTAFSLFALWLKLPREDTHRIFAALGQIRWERVGRTFHAPSSTQDGIILEANQSSIEVKSNGRTLSLMHPKSEDATVSINLQGSAGVRYVDTDTGQVTMNKVYYVQ